MKKFLIVGLGNPGEQYEDTRHNIGFKVVEAIASRFEQKFETAKLGDVCKFKYKGKSILLLKPSTFMNLSGKAVQHYMHKENLTKEQVLVVTDDLNLSFGTLRMKAKGSDGGHNGLKDIIKSLQSAKYPRLRFGISDEYVKGQQVDYVLGHWTQEELNSLPERVDRAVDMCLSFTHHGIANTMNQYNGT